MKPFLIAEIGINHNGDIGIAKQLMDAAKDAGCSAVKFQKRTIDTVYTQEFLDSPRQSQWGTTQREQKKGLEFGRNEYYEIDAYSKKIGIYWFASAWDIDSQIFLDNYNLKYNKIASAMLTHIPLLNHVAKERKLTFISTGMSTLDNIDEAVHIFDKYKCPYVLMHCVSVYPCPLDRLNVKMVKTLKDRYNCEVGYSSHSPGILDTSIAVLFGAKYIEVHVTLDRAMYGSDQAASLEPRGLKLTVRDAESVLRMIGSDEKVTFKQEQDVAKKLRYWQ